MPFGEANDIFRGYRPIVPELVAQLFRRARNPVDPEQSSKGMQARFAHLLFTLSGSTCSEGALEPRLHIFAFHRGNSPSNGWHGRRDEEKW
ncbi:MAG: hypothetical protein ABW023_08950 [Sphingomonas sp.]